MADSLEKLKKQLYEESEALRRRRERDTLAELQDLGEKKEHKIPSWGESEALLLVSQKRAWFSNKVVIAAVSVLAIAALVGAYLLFFGAGVSSGQVELEITGPSSIGGGDRAVWTVIVRHNGKTAIESAEIAFEYPETARLVSELSKVGAATALIERKNVGGIAAGGRAEERFEAFVFGEADSIQRVRVSLEYRMKGSSAILAREASADLKISSSPVGVSVQMPDKVNIGQEVEIEATFSSAASEDINDLVLRAEYPSGFKFVSASPAPTVSSNTWEIKKLPAKGAATLRVKGILSGENLEHKAFKFIAGVKAGVGVENIIVYGAGIASAELRKPFLDIAIKVNGQDKPVASAGDYLSVSVFWKNNLPVGVKNAVVELKLDGRIFDDGSISVTNGFYRGYDRMVIWNPSSYRDFAFVNAGQEGELKFRIRVARSLPIAGAGDINFSGSMTAHMYASERPEGFEGIDIDGRALSTTNISSSLQVSSQGYFYSDTLPNSGSLPPMAGSETTYTIVWSLANSSNDAENVRVSAVLPSYVSWKNIFLPSDENIVYNAADGKIVWTIARLPAGTGIVRPAREVSFQVGIIPSLGQVGSSPVLISETTAEARDTFTSVTLRDIKNAVSTRLYNDSRMDYTQYSVVK